MNDYFKQKAKLKTDAELRVYIDHREKYLPESVEAAVAELQNRGFEFSEEELKVIIEDMQARRAQLPSTNNFNLFKYSDSYNQIEDEEAPLFYSKRAIYVFSVLFSVLFGSVMLAMNVAKTKGAAKSLLVVLFGILYTGFIFTIAVRFNLNTFSGLFLSMIGAYFMIAFFWGRFIGNEVLYRPRKIWGPLIVGIILVAAFVIMIQLALKMTQQ